MLVGLCSFKVKDLRQNISRENCYFDAGKNDSAEFSINNPISLSYERWQFRKEIGLILPTEHCVPLTLGLFTIICFPLRKL